MKKLLLALSMLAPLAAFAFPHHDDRWNSRHSPRDTFSFTIVQPLVTTRMRESTATYIREDRTRDAKRISDLIVEGQALDSFIYDGIRLCRLQGVLPQVGQVTDFDISLTANSRYVSRDEAMAWLWASKEINSRHKRELLAIADVEDMMLDQASSIFTELDSRLSRHEAITLMPRYAAANHIMDRPQTVIVRERVVQRPVIIREVSPFADPLWRRHHRY